MSVIIPIRKYSDSLRELLFSIVEQKFAFSIEVLVVLNSLEPKDFDQLKISLAPFSENLKLLNINLLYIAQIGVNFARNAGLRAAKNDLIIFFDDDCLLGSPQLLAQHFQHHSQYPGLFALGGLYSLPVKANFFSRVYNSIQMSWLYAGLEAEQGTRANYLIGGHFSVKKDMLVEYKILFNEQILYGGSELEFFLQAKKYDLRVELSELSVTHLACESFISLSKKLYKQGAGKAISERNFPNQSYSEGDDLRSKWSNSGRINFFIAYFNYVFWFGYYAFQQRKSDFVRHVISNFVGSIRSQKFLLLKQIDLKESVKTKRGDRL